MFRIHEPIYDESKAPLLYCHEGTYKFAFYSLVIAYVLMFAMFALACGMCCCMCCCSCFGAAAVAATSGNSAATGRDVEATDK